MKQKKKKNHVLSQSIDPLKNTKFLHNFKNYNKKPKKTKKNKNKDEQQYAQQHRKISSN